MKIIKIENSDRYKIVGKNGNTFSDCFGHGFKTIHSAYLGMIGSFKRKKKRK